MSITSQCDVQKRCTYGKKSMIIRQFLCMTKNNTYIKLIFKLKNNGSLERYTLAIIEINFTRGKRTAISIIKHLLKQLAGPRRKHRRQRISEPTFTNRYAANIILERNIRHSSSLLSHVPTTKISDRWSRGSLVRGPRSFSAMIR